jgi:hypothetical protein
LVSEAALHGVKLGAVASGSRNREDGVVLSWHLTDPFTVLANGIVPFFIDWGQTPHPAQFAAQGSKLANLRAEHPEPPPHRCFQERKAAPRPGPARFGRHHRAEGTRPDLHGRRRPGAWCCSVQNPRERDRHRNRKRHSRSEITPARRAGTFGASKEAFEGSAGLGVSVVICIASFS